MSSVSQRLRNVSSAKLLIGIVITCVAALSVHVVMLQVFDVPYPVDYPAQGWPLALNLFCQAFALIVVYGLAKQELGYLGWFTRVILLFLLSAGLHESIIRVPLMNGFATTAWRYSLVAGLPRILTSFYLCLPVVLIAPRLKGLGQRVLGAIGIAAVVHFLCVPLTNQLFARNLAALAYLDHPEVWKAPYDWHIEVPAYVTYLEPVLACLFLIALVWDRLPGPSFLRLLRFCALVLAINTTLVRPFVYIFFAKFGPITALLSQGQFFLEAMTLALLTASYWSYCLGNGSAVEKVQST